MFLFAAIVIEGASSESVAKRSERWDKYIQGIEDAHEERRMRRQVGAEWYTNRSDCNPAEYTRFDHLGRRASGLLATPQNQGWCGSCWAFASVNTLTDQLSIAQNSSQPLLSADYLTSCTKYGIIYPGLGCCGAMYLSAGPVFLKDNGTVTSTCSPYKLNFTLCFFSIFRRLVCPELCSNGSPANPSSFRIMSYQQLYSNQAIQAALDGGGVVLVAMNVTQEFCTYKCGVYQDSGSTPVLGGHAVEIVDYGTTDSGINFWVAKNSWGDTTEENGYFRIERGQLQIGENGNAIQLVLPGSAIDDPDQQLQNASSNISICAETPVRNPESDEMIGSALEMVEQQLITMNSLLCKNDARGSAIGFVRESIVITKANIQVVAGIRLNIEINVDIMGCSNTTKANIAANAIIDQDGNFNLDIQSVKINGAKDLATRWWILLLLATLATVISQMY